MHFAETRLKGSYLIEIERQTDERGFFARTWCQQEFSEHGLNADLVQCSVSHNKRSGTLRGMHWQAAPHEEAKLVTCIRGRMYDVIIDLRDASATFKQWIGVELSAENRTALYIPAGFAHGFQTLEDDTEVFYHMAEFYHPELQRGFRWNDPAFGIKWPLPNPIMSERDGSYPDYSKEIATPPS
jgi:dTDP-4-dehydrorhamnose 3,5-epimerase